MASDTPADTSAKLAVLIDADNASPAVIDGLLAEVAKYGTAHVKRAYGDWTGTNLRGWKDQLLDQSIQPIQQFAYTTGKNATDAAMVIDAMDLLYSGRFDGFCLVSSDSDFTRLASRHPRVRPDRVRVRGAQDPEAVRRGLRQVHLHREPDRSPQAAAPAGAAVSPRHAKPPRRPAEGRRRAGEHAPQRGGGQLRRRWLGALGSVGNIITKQRPDFDSRNYGYAKLSDLMAATTLFDLERRVPGDGKAAVIYARDNRRRTPA